MNKLVRSKPKRAAKCSNNRSRKSAWRSGPRRSRSIEVIVGQFGFSQRLRRQAAKSGLILSTGAKVADPLRNCDADMGDRPPGNANIALIVIRLDRQAKIVQGVGQGQMQALEVSRKREPALIESHDRINRQLAWLMKDAAAAAIDPAHRQAVGAHLAAGRLHVGPAPLAAYANLRRMLAEHDESAAALALNLIDELSLQVKRSIELHQAEHVGPENAFRGKRLLHRHGYKGSIYITRPAKHPLAGRRKDLPNAFQQEQSSNVRKAATRQR